MRSKTRCGPGACRHRLCQGMEANEDSRRIRYAYPIDIQCNGLFDIFRHYNPDLPPRRPPPHYYHNYHKQDMIALLRFLLLRCVCSRNSPRGVWTMFKSVITSCNEVISVPLNTRITLFRMATMWVMRRNPKAKKLDTRKAQSKATKKRLHVMADFVTL